APAKAEYADVVPRRLRDQLLRGHPPAAVERIEPRGERREHEHTAPHPRVSRRSYARCASPLAEASQRAVDPSVSRLGPGRTTPLTRSVQTSRTRATRALSAPRWVAMKRRCDRSCSRYIADGACDVEAPPTCANRASGQSSTAQPAWSSRQQRSVSS